MQDDVVSWRTTRSVTGALPATEDEIVFRRLCKHYPGWASSSDLDTDAEEEKNHPVCKIISELFYLILLRTMTQQKLQI